ncbi:YciI family protein [Actinotalea sp.]|uniref:YciI family protein n=1 Tax=Actinotalea sp. TaxID=1872145 RepID=UPI0035663C41
MRTFVIEYRYDDQDLARAEVRPEHRAFLRSLLDAGTLIASGPFDGDTGALLLVRAESQDAVADLFDTDPFHRAGLVAERTVRGWEPVLHTWAD